MDKNIRAAVVGVGYLGNFHAQKYVALESVDLVAVVDSDVIRCAEIAQKYGVPGYQDYRQIIDQVDIVSIAVPTEDHYAIAKCLLEAGIHVLIEKPMTRTVAEAEDLISIAQSKCLVLQIGHLERFNPAVLALQDILCQPRFIESHRMAVFQPRGTDVSVVLDLMIHDIDIILSLVNSELVAIRPAGFPVLTDEIDIANVRLEFANGCVANVTASRVSQQPMRKIRLFQSDTYISIDYLERKISCCKRVPDPTGPLHYRLIQESRQFDQGDALLQEIAAFVESVRLAKTPVVSGEAGKKALEVALQIVNGIEGIQH